MVRYAHARELIDRPVVTLDTAEDIAEVKDVVVDPTTSELAGFTLKGRGFFSSPSKGVLSITRVAAVGNDAIMIPAAGVVTESDERMAAAAAHPGKIIGIDVITDTGKVLGKVADLILVLEPASTSVIGYEIHTPERTTALMPLPEAFSVSREAAIVPASVEEYISSDLRAFSGAVEQFRFRLRGASQ